MRYDSDDKVFILTMVLIAIITLGVVGFVIKEEYLDRKAPEETVVAVVKNKDIRTSTTTTIINKVPHTTTTRHYDVTFELENNSTKEFSLSQKTYKQLSEKDKGKLTFKRNKFVRFVYD